MTIVYFHVFMDFVRTCYRTTFNLLMVRSSLRKKGVGKTMHVPNQIRCQLNNAMVKQQI